MRTPLLAAAVAAFVTAPAVAAEPAPARVLLIGDAPDGHPWGAHEFRAGVRVLSKLLADVPNLTVATADAERDADSIPEKVDAADAVVLFVTQGGRWVGSNRDRLAAFRRLAARGGGIVALHWAVGAKDARYVEVARSLWGGCHGGSDRKYVLDPRLLTPNPDHPVTAGMSPFTIKDEWYYRLKFADAGTVTPLLTATIDGEPQTLAWAWDRPDGGRSVGFVGLHFHENWADANYRRLVTRGVLWTLHRDPAAFTPPATDPRDLTEPRPKISDEARKAEGRRSEARAAADEAG